MWNLQFNDGGGLEFYDEPELAVGCIGGHEVCYDNCNVASERPVHPRPPQMQIDYFNQAVWYIEYYVVQQNPTKYCDAPADQCWNDVNITEATDGYEVPYLCGQ